MVGPYLEKSPTACSEIVVSAGVASSSAKNPIRFRGGSSTWCFYPTLRDFTESSLAVSFSKLLSVVVSTFNLGVKAALLFAVWFYRAILGAHFGGSCRFHPTCSQYAVEALQRHSPWQALKLIFKRLLQCRPGGAYGYDPVPDGLSVTSLSISVPERMHQ